MNVYLVFYFIKIRILRTHTFKLVTKAFSFNCKQIIEDFTIMDIKNLQDVELKEIDPINHWYGIINMTLQEAG